MVPSAIVHVDGGSRGNPGPAGYGFVLLREGLPPLRGNGRLSHATNNVAEYTGLIEALRKSQELGLKQLLVRSDSELLVRQMNGQYRVKDAKLQDLFAQAKELAAAIGDVRFVHVYREQNAEADRLANLAMDGQLVAEIEATETQEPEAKPLPSLREATRRKASARKATDSDWSGLVGAFLAQGVDRDLAERLVSEVRRLGFVPPRH